MCVCVCRPIKESELEPEEIELPAPSASAALSTAHSLHEQGEERKQLLHTIGKKELARFALHHRGAPREATRGLNIDLDAPIAAAAEDSEGPLDFSRPLPQGRRPARLRPRELQELWEVRASTLPRA